MSGGPGICQLFNSILHVYKKNYYSYQKMVKIKFVDLFKTNTNNFVPSHLFRISQSLSEKLNFWFLITFFTIKTKTVRFIKKWSKSKLYIFLRWTILLFKIFLYLPLFSRKPQLFIFNNVFLTKIKTVRFSKKWSKQNL